jgi:putative cell wall-binding protein
MAFSFQDLTFLTQMLRIRYLSNFNLFVWTKTSIIMLKNSDDYPRKFHYVCKTFAHGSKKVSPVIYATSCEQLKHPISTNLLTNVTVYINPSRRIATPISPFFENNLPRFLAKPHLVHLTIRTVASKIENCSRNAKRTTCASNVAPEITRLIDAKTHKISNRFNRSRTPKISLLRTHQQQHKTQLKTPTLKLIQILLSTLSQAIHPRAESMLKSNSLPRVKVIQP